MEDDPKEILTEVYSVPLGTKFNEEIGQYKDRHDKWHKFQRWEITTTREKALATATALLIMAANLVSSLTPDEEFADMA